MDVRNILLLGCGGFIGSHFLDKLMETGQYRVAGWDYVSDRITQHLGNPRFTFHQGDVFSHHVAAELERQIVASDVVMSLTAICNPSWYNTEPIATIKSNFTEVAHLVEMCAAHRRWLIYASTSEVYGRTIASYLPGKDYSNQDLYQQTEETTPLVLGPIHNQRWSYACAKQLSERLIYAFHAQHRMPFTIFRPYNFFGPRMDFIPGRNGEGVPRVLACFMAALLNDEPIRLVDGGHARRTFLYILDAVDALHRMIQTPRAAQNQIFNVGSRLNEVSIRQLAELMREAYAKATGEPKYLGHPIVEISSQEFYGSGYEDCDRRMPDTRKVQRLLGWEPKHNIEETVYTTVRYFESEFRSSAAAE